MQGARQLALAGAGFAEQQDVRIGVGDLPGGVQHRHHRRAVGVQAGAALEQLVLEGFQARGQLAHFELLGGGQAQLFRAARLDQVIGRAETNGVHRGVHRRMRGDDHHAHPRREQTHLLEHLQAVVLAQAQIEEAQVEHLTLQQALGLRRAGGGGHPIAVVLQAIAEGAQDGGFVVDQQDAAAGVGRVVHGVLGSVRRAGCRAAARRLPESSLADAAALGRPNDSPPVGAAGALSRAGD